MVNNEIIKIQANNLIYFYRNHPVIAAYDLLGVELDEIQRIIFRDMWFKDYVIVVACRGLGKSFLQALLATLRAMLYPGHRVGLIGSSYRQAKVIFREVEDLYNKSDIFKEATLRPPIKSTDMCEIKFKSAGTYSASSILAIPLGNDGSKIRGQRFFSICVSGDTFIRSEKGLILIKDIVSRLDTKIETLKGLHYPTRYIRNPIGPMYKITTSKGFEIAGTPDHPLYCNVNNRYKFVPINKLSVNNKVVIKAFDPNMWPVKSYYKPKSIHIKVGHSADTSVTTPDFVTEDLALFLGFIVSEGHIRQPSTIQFANKDIEIIDTYMALVRGLFSKTPNIRYIVPLKYGEDSGYYDTQLSSVIVRKYLENLGLDYCLSKDKTIPFSILQSPLQVICAFLKGLFEGDGCIHRNYKGRNRPVITYTSISLKLVKQIQVLLINLGIVSYFRINRRSAICKHNDYVLSITGEDVYKFMDLIGFVSSRKSNKIKEFNRDGNFKVKLNNDGYFMDKIKTIECLEDDVSYDFTIPKCCSFMSNGFVSHNCADEFCQIPEQIFNLVIRPMAITQHSPMENVKRMRRKKELMELGIDVEDDVSINKIIMTSSGFFKVNHMWNRMKHYWKKIESGDKTYAVHQASYTDLSEGFLNQSNIEEARETMPKALFEMEYCGKMISDSEGFFKASLIESCIANKIDNYFTVELEGKKGFEYIMAIDPARTSDSFAILIFKACGAVLKLVYAVTYTGVSSLNTVHEIFRLRDKFNLIRIVMDSQGGGHNIKDLLEAGIDNNKPILDILDKDNYGRDGDLILQLYNPSPSSNTDANFTALAMLEKKAFLFPGPPQQALDEEDDLYEYIGLLKKQLLSIVVTQNPNGTLNFNTQSSRAKKDLYSCFIMGCWAAKQLEKEKNITTEQEKILSYGGVIKNRTGDVGSSDFYVDRINNFDGVSRPLIVPTIL